MEKQNKAPITPDEFFQSEKYIEFIEDFENQWLQYATAEERVKAFWGSTNAALEVYKHWKKGGKLFNDRKGWLKNCFSFSEPRPENFEA